MMHSGDSDDEGPTFTKDLLPGTIFYNLDYCQYYGSLLFFALCSIWINKPGFHSFLNYHILPFKYFFFFLMKSVSCKILQIWYTGLFQGWTDLCLLGNLQGVLKTLKYKNHSEE